MSKHRRLELVHFCLQYPDWKKELLAINYAPVCDFHEVKTNNTTDPTAKIALRATYFMSRIKMVEDAAVLADEGIANYILKAATTGASYQNLLANGIPCSKDYFYDRYRKFYYILSDIRK